MGQVKWYQFCMQSDFFDPALEGFPSLKESIRSDVESEKMSTKFHKCTMLYPESSKEKRVWLKHLKHGHISKLSSTIVSSQQPKDSRIEAATANYLTFIASVMSVWRDSKTSDPCNPNPVCFIIRDSALRSYWKMTERGRNEPPWQTVWSLETATYSYQPFEEKVNRLEKRKQVGTGRKPKDITLRDARNTKASNLVGQLHQIYGIHLGRGESKSVVTNLQLNKVLNYVEAKVFQKKSSYQQVLLFVIQIQTISELYSQIILISCVITVRQLLLGIILKRYDRLCRKLTVKITESQNCRANPVHDEIEGIYSASLCSVNSGGGNMDGSYPDVIWEGDEFIHMGDHNPRNDIRQVPDFGDLVDEDLHEEAHGTDEWGSVNDGGDEDARLPREISHDIHSRDAPNHLIDEFANGTLCDPDEMQIYLGGINDPLPPGDDAFVADVNIQDWLVLEEVVLAAEDFDAANAA